MSDRHLFLVIGLFMALMGAAYAIVAIVDSSGPAIVLGAAWFILAGMACYFAWDFD